jgi:hypothetical protein
MVSTHRFAFHTGLVLALAITSACEDAAPRCGTLDGCDVRSPACQRRALSYAVCLRGRDEPLELAVPVETLSRAEFEAAWVADAQAAEDDVGRALRRGLVLLALRSPDADAASDARWQARQVAATYSYDPPRITIVDSGRALTGSYVATLVHEYVHALQHASGDADRATVPARFDAELAHSSLIEGEATILGDETLLQGIDVRFDQAKYTRTLSEYRNVSGRFFPSRREDVYGSLYRQFTYAFGASYLWELRQREGLGAIAGAFETPPVSTFAVMARDPGRPDQRENDLGADAVPVLPDLTLQATRHLGRFAYSAAAQVFRPGGYVRTFPPESSFVADTLSVFASPDDSVLAVWRIRFDDDSAAAFVDRSRDLPSGAVRFRSEGNDLIILASEDAALLDALPDELTYEAAGDDYVPEDERARARRLSCFEHTWPSSSNTSADGS